MEAVWAGTDGATVDDIRSASPAAAAWADTTLRTLIHRLVRKAALRSRRRQGGVTYHATVTREAFVAAETQSLADRLFGGQVTAMFAHLARTRPLVPEDRERLRRLVATLDADADD